jgi:hypothetical protein
MFRPHSDEVHDLAKTLSAAQLTYALRRDDGDFVVFCFAKPEDAEVFRERPRAHRKRRTTLDSKAELRRRGPIGGCPQGPNSCCPCRRIRPPLEYLP